MLAPKLEITNDYWPCQREGSLSDPHLHLGLPAELSVTEQQAAYGDNKNKERR